MIIHTTTSSELAKFSGKPELFARAGTNRNDAIRFPSSTVTEPGTAVTRWVLLLTQVRSPYQWRTDGLQYASATFSLVPFNCLYEGKCKRNGICSC